MWERSKKTYFNPPQLPILVSLSSSVFVTISLYGRVWQLRFSSESTSWWPFRSTGEFANLKDHRRAKTQHIIVLLVCFWRRNCFLLWPSCSWRIRSQGELYSWCLLEISLFNAMNDIKFEFEDRRHDDQMISV